MRKVTEENIYAGTRVPHVSRLLRDVGFLGPVLLRICQRYDRQGHDFSRVVKRHAITIALWRRLNLARFGATLKRVRGAHGPVPLRMCQRHDRQGHDFSRVVKRHAITIALWRRLNLARFGATLKRVLLGGAAPSALRFKRLYNQPASAVRCAQQLKDPPGGGYRIHWPDIDPDIDKDLTTEGLLATRERLERGPRRNRFRPRLDFGGWLRPRGREYYQRLCNEGGKSSLIRRAAPRPHPPALVILSGAVFQA